MDGNPNAQNIENGLVELKAWASRGDIDDVDVMKLALRAESALAVAFELRTLTLALAQGTPGWLDEVRARLGHPTAPETVHHQCEAWELREGADGARYCAACGKQWEPRESRYKRCEKMVDPGHGNVRCWLNAGHDEPCS